MFDKPQLLIICEDKYREHANYLLQLISQDDKKFTGKIGVKAGIFSPKLYKANLHQISSDQYLIFIGPSDEAKKQNSTIPNVFRDRCLHYGWLGNTGTLYVDDSFRALSWKDLKVMIPCALWGPLYIGYLLYRENSMKRAEKEFYKLLVKKFYENGLKSFMKLHD